MRNYIVCFKDSIYGPMYVPLGTDGIDFTLVVDEKEKEQILSVYRLLTTTQRLVRAKKVQQETEEWKGDQGELPTT